MAVNKLMQSEETLPNPNLVVVPNIVGLEE
jgi:hypothetical protein